MYLAVGNAIDPETGQQRPMPREYIEYVLCTQFYHCTPAELAVQDYETLLLHIEFFNLEQEVKKSQS